MSSLRLHFWSITGTLMAFLVSLWINQEVFAYTSFVRGVNWIYLPSGVRLLGTLLLGFDGAIGLLLAGLITDFLYWFPHDPVRAIAGAFLGSLAPYLVYRLALEYYDLRASLTNLTPKRLLVLAVAYSIANPLFHHVWFALTGATKNWFDSFFTMFVGDLTGALIILYAMKGILALLPKQPGNSPFRIACLAFRWRWTVHTPTNWRRGDDRARRRVGTAHPRASSHERAESRKAIMCCFV